MGCNNSKASALQELEQIIHQISIENDQLEKERDKLKSQHDDRPEEEKDSLQDLRLMHSDLEKEIKELKEIMLDFMPIPESKDKNFLLIKSSIERIAEIQLEIKCKQEEEEKEKNMLEHKKIEEYRLALIQLEKKKNEEKKERLMQIQRENYMALISKNEENLRKKIAEDLNDRQMIQNIVGNILPNVI